MLHKMSAFFQAPVFKGNEEKTRRARALNALQMYMGGAVLVFGFIGVVFIFEEKVISSITILIGLLITVFEIYLNRQGRVTLSSIILLVTLWMTGVFLMIMSGGIQSQHIMIFISGTVITGIILEVRGGLVFAGVSILTVSGFVIADQMGYQFPKTFPLPPLSIWAILVMYLSFIVIPLQVAFQSLADSASYATASSERYQMITSVMSDYAFFTQFAADGSVDEQWVSGAFESITGYTSEEYFAKGGWRAILHPDCLERDDEAMKKLHANQKVIAKNRVVRKDGGICWVVSFAHPKWDDVNNRLIGIYGAVQDVTEQKQAERALRLSEEKFAKAFQTTQVLMTIEDEKGVFVDINAAFEETFGVSRDQIVGHTASQLNIFYDSTDAQSLRKEMQAKGFLKDFETRFRRKDGGIGFILLSTEKLLVDKAEYVLTSGLDVTARKQMEEKYRNIFNNSIEGIFQSTDDGHFLQVNPAMARIYGYDSPEDMLHNVNDIGRQIYVDSEQRNEVRNRLIKGEKLEDYQTQEFRKDGSVFWSSMNAQAISDENRKFLYYEGTVEDITSRKQAEAEREALIDELETKNEELERFTYTVSHDLKSPLVTINGFLGYLEQDAISGNVERLKKDMQRIQEAVNKMQKLLNELLELSRIGRLMNHPETMSFDELVREAIDIVQGRLNERGVAVHILPPNEETHPNLPLVYGDKQRLVEVMQNLLDNAAKYMGDQADPQIEIGLNGDEDGKPIFFVKDNGIGIASEYHERIFGLFNKLDAKSEGTGVGLALVKRIVEVHGGRIWVQSEPSPKGGAGKGSTFYFTLPAGHSS